MKTISLSKINIYLKVKGKLPNGFNAIETVFLPLKYPADTISINSTSLHSLTITSNSKNLPLNKNNICWQAAMQYSEKCNIPPHWNIHIEKQIPISAGLGGGSSNAASVLKLLNDKYKKLNSKELFTIANNLGSDVPFFLNPTFSIGTDRGTILTPIDIPIPKKEIILLNPLFPISASWAYKNRTKIHNDNTVNDAINSFINTPEVYYKYFRNDLQPAAFKKFPFLKILQNDLVKAGACFVGMTGSGPTLFALPSKNQTSDNIIDKMKYIYTSSILCIKAETI
jgi:4-diphosphocytidyl-2-C-methyl-D-erythritol kinase